MPAPHEGATARRDRLARASCARAARWSVCNSPVFPLLVGAGLLARTVYNVQRVELGFAAERLLLVRVACARSSRPRPPQPIRRASSKIAGSRRHRGDLLAARLFTGGSRRDVEVEGHAATGDEDRDRPSMRSGRAISRPSGRHHARTRHHRRRSRRRAEGSASSTRPSPAVLRPAQPRHAHHLGRRGGTRRRIRSSALQETSARRMCAATSSPGSSFRRRRGRRRRVPNVPDRSLPSARRVAGTAGD